MNFTQNDLKAKFLALQEEYKKKPEEKATAIDPEEAQQKKKDYENWYLNRETINKYENQTIKRLGFSDYLVNDKLDRFPNEGDCFHVLTAGDVDLMSFLNWATAGQKLDYLIISSWVVSAIHIAEIEEKVKKGYIKTVDFYASTICWRQFIYSYKAMEEVAQAHGGRVCIFNDHAKLLLGFGEKFNFIVESSGNLQQNVRSENFTVTIDKQLPYYYKEILDSVKSWDNNFNDWKARAI